MVDPHCDAFFHRGFTACGAPFLAGGFCRPGQADRCARDLAGLESLSLAGCTDPRELDQLLARGVQKHCGQSVWAVGVTLWQPGVVASTGGVLGNPHIAAQSAAGEIEDIGHGLLLYTRPGGPGIVARCQRRDMEPLLNDSFFSPHKGRVTRVAAHLRRQKLDAFMLLTDGSGLNATGLLLIENAVVKINEAIPAGSRGDIPKGGCHAVS